MVIKYEEQLFDGWIDGSAWDFMSFLTVFQSYRDGVWMIMKGCVQWNLITVGKISASNGARTHDR